MKQLCLIECKLQCTLLILSILIIKSVEFVYIYMYHIE